MSKTAPSTSVSQSNPSNSAVKSPNPNSSSFPTPSSTATPSAWARGPPSNLNNFINSSTSAAPSASNSNSATNSNVVTPNETPNPNSNSALPNVSGVKSPASSVAGSVSGQAAHSRKASILAVGGAGDESPRGMNGMGVNGPNGVEGVKNGAVPIGVQRGGSGISFGSISNPNAQLSSSPASNPVLGAHLGPQDGVKTFGSVEAGESKSVIGKKPAAGGNAGKFDVNKLFQMPGAPSAGGANAQPNAGPASASPSLSGSNTPAVPNVTSPGSGVNPNQPGFRVPGLQQGQPMMQQARGYDAQGRPVMLPAGMMGAGAAYNPYQQAGGPGPSRSQLNAQGNVVSPAMSNQNPRSPNPGHQQPNLASPNMNPYSPQPNAANFRPGGMPGSAARGGPQAMAGGQGARGQGIQAYGMHPQQQQYPGMPYGAPQYYGYPGGYYQPESPYVQQQGWQGQGQYSGTPLSPRAGNASLASASPAPSHATLAGGNQNGGVGTPNVPNSVARPVAGHSLSNFSTASSQSSVPSTPQQSAARPAGTFQPGVPFTPGHMSSPSASLHASASTFVPRAKSSAIKISRPDGTAVDLASAAKEAKSPSPAGTPSLQAASTPTKPAQPKQGLPSLPVVVRMETEAQKAKRLADQEEEKKRRAIEEKEEKERKEREASRKEREEKEKAEKAEKERLEKEKAEAEEKAAKEKAEKEEKERIEAEEAKKKADAEAAEKAVAEAERIRKEVDAEAKRQAEEEAAKKEADAKVSARVAAAGLPAKPSPEVLDSARASPAPANSTLAPPSEGRSSNAPSPTASPSLSHATLPAKPAGLPSTLARKPAPTALTLATESTPSSPIPGSGSAQALVAARAIDQLDSVSYPSGTQSPNSALNQNAEPGKFRYDRDFLLQFMNVCRDKPESLPPLSELGMEKDLGGSMGRGGSSRGGQRSSSQMGGVRGAGGMGLGIGGGNMGAFGGGKPVGMGSFGMGSFTQPARTSEERLAASRNNMANAFGAARNAPSMARAPSQSGPSNMGMMPAPIGRETSRAGSSRGKPRRGDQRAPSSAMAPSQFEPDVAPLEVSANRWAPAGGRRPGAVDENSPEFIERKVKGLLNKLTKENFPSISTQILDWANRSINENDGQTLRLVIKLIFEKAKDEQFWSSMYAELCYKLLQDLSPEIQDEKVLNPEGKSLKGGALFRKYLLNRCQEDFERGWKSKEDASAAAKNKASEDEKNKAEHDAAIAAGKEVEEFKFSDEYYAEQAAKRQGLGLVKFVGELYKLDMLSLKIMNACTIKLLSNVVNPDEEDVESLCQLMSTIGGKIAASGPQAQSTLAVFLQRAEEMSKSDQLSSRMKFMLQDVLALAANGWKAKGAQAQSGPMTIDEVHRQAAREQADAARAAANTMAANRDGNISRGGSKRGDQRGGGFPGANNDWQNVTQRLPMKPADMTGFGNIKTGGGPAAFNPSSIFAKKPKTRSGEATPPTISRSASVANITGVNINSTNPFAALEGGDHSAEQPAGEDAGAEPTQRKRLVLAPRTKSSGNANEDGETDSPGAETPAVEEEPSNEMSKEDIEKKIKADLTEFWGEKGTVGTRNIDDAVSYFEALPEEGRQELAKTMIDDVFRRAAAADAELIAKAFTQAIEAGHLTAEIVKAGLKPSAELLDDLAIDVPLAYNFAAQIALAAKLPQEDMVELGDAIEDFGSPDPKPKEKFLAEVEKLSKA